MVTALASALPGLSNGQPFFRTLVELEKSVIYQGITGIVAVAVIAAAQCVAADPNGSKVSSAAETKLTHTEENLIRKIVYEKRFMTTMRGPDGSEHRQVVLDKRVIELYQKNPISTSERLLDIVRGGRSEDARAAAGTALALQKDPIFAVAMADGDLATFDEERADGESLRDVLAEEVQRGLKELKSRRKKE
jgi:hypothetical protein